MTDKEFDILDELYFLQSYRVLRNLIKMPEEDLRDELMSLFLKGWIRCYKNPEEEIDFDASRFKMEYQKYYYLASKEGLLAHNSNF